MSEEYKTLQKKKYSIKHNVVLKVKKRGGIHRVIIHIFGRSRVPCSHHTAYAVESSTVASFVVYFKIKKVKQKGGEGKHKERRN